MVEKNLENTSFSSEANNDDEDIKNQLTVEQQAQLDSYLLMLLPEYHEQFTTDYVNDILENGTFSALTLTPYFPFLDFGGSTEDGLRKIPVFDDKGMETGKYQTFDGYFKDFPISGILSAPSSEGEVIEFQRYLENQGVVPQGYFDNTLGEYSSDLMEVVQDIMNWADENMNIFPGSPEYNDLEKKTDVRFFFSQDEEPENSMQRKLFSEAIKGYSQAQKDIDIKEQEQRREGIELDLFEQLLDTTPSDEEFVTLFEEALEATGKRVTPKMLNAAATAFSKAHMEDYQNNIDMIANFKQSDIYADYIAGTNVKRSDVPIGGYMQTERRLNKDFFKEPFTAEGFLEDYVEENYGEEMDAAERGRKKVEVQQKVLPYVLRYITP